jgi:hypothetical protein
VLDRYSSGILGRPFAISEEDISVLLPVNAYDDHIATAGPEGLDATYTSEFTLVTEMSIFIVFIELRRISSRIHTTFYNRRSPGLQFGSRSEDTQSIGHFYAAYTQFKTELDAWRLTVPVFSSPRSLYERSDWHEFMYSKDMLLLTRGALHSLPSPLVPSSSATKELVDVCYTSAAQVIQLYADLMDKRAITWTRSYFQVIFTAGLTVIYCISLGVLKNILQPIDGQHEAIETIARCGRILSHFRDQMPDAGSFAIVFDIFKEECVQSILGHGNPTVNQDIINGAADLSAAVDFPPQQTGAVNGNWPFMESDPNMLDFSSFGTNFGLTDGFMSQLEAGLGEYAWGSLTAEGDFLDHFSFP